MLPLDYRKTPMENFHDVLTQSLNSLNCTKPARLNYLNNLVRLLVRYPSNEFDRGFSQRELLICIRSLLVDEEREIRTAALRVTRYLIRDESDFQEALCLKYDLLIVRCLDIVLDNHLERMQCARLLSHLTKICPNKITLSLIRALLAICSDGADDNDKLTKATSAILCELVVKRPDVLLQFGDVSWLVRTILGCQSVRLSECLMSVLANLMNGPKFRRKLLSGGTNIYLEIFAPLIDANFKLSGVDKDEKIIQLRKESDVMFENCRAALVSALRNWTGIVACLSQSTTVSYSSDPFLSSPIQTVIASLCLDSEQIQQTVVDTLCEVLNLPYKDERWDTWERTLELAEFSAFNEYKFSLNHNFVNADANYFLPDWNSSRADLTSQMNSLVLCGFIDGGLINTLLKIVLPNPNKSISFKILLILVDLTTKCGQVLPPSWRHLCYSMPAVLQQLCEESSSLVEKQNARLIVNRLEILSDSKRRAKKPRTLQLEMMISRYKSDSPNILPSSSARGAQNFHVIDRIHELIKESRSLQPYSNYSAWEWSFIHLALQLMLDSKHSFDDSVCSKFIGQILNFYDPQSGQFCKMTDDYKNYTRTGCLLMKIFSKLPHDSSINVQLKLFLAQLSNSLTADRLHVGLLSAKNIMSSSCADYFLFLGELSSTDAGRISLEKAGIIQRLSDLLSSDNHEAYAKLIITGLDYSKPGAGRSLLQKCLISNKIASRQYATEFLGVLGKLKVASFDDWGLDLLLSQLYDACESIVETAAEILDELLNYEIYKNSFVSKRPSLLPLGDAGVLLQTYFVSNEKNLQIGQPVNFIEHELERWKQEFNEKYVDIVDEMIHEAVSSYCRLPNGHFPRHSSSNSEPMGAVYAPPHLYGQLVKHTAGCQLLVQYDCLAPLLDALQFAGLDTEMDIARIKSSLWALGHICSTDLGVALLPTQTIPCMVKIAEECPLFGLRGAAFFALNLTAQSPAGADRLGQLGWYSNSIWTPAHPANFAGLRNPTPIEDRLLLRPPDMMDDNVSAVSDSSSIPSTPFKTTPSIKNLNKKCLDSSDSGRKMSSGNSEWCQISVRSCVSCELCRMFDASSSVLNATEATTPTSEGCSCPVHGRSAGDDAASSSYCIPVDVRCTVSDQFLSEDEDQETPTIVVQRKTTRSKSVGASEQDPDTAEMVAKSPRALMYLKKACESTSTRRKSATMPNNSSAAMLSRTFPSTHFRSFSFGGGNSNQPEDQNHICESAVFSWTLDNDESYRNLSNPQSDAQGPCQPRTISLCRAPAKSPDTSNLMRRRLGFRKQARKSRGLPTIGYERRNDDVFVETVTDSDVDGIQKWRLLQTERALSEGVVPKFHQDTILIEDDATVYESPSKSLNFSGSTASAPSVVCLPIDIGLICSIDIEPTKFVTRWTSPDDGTVPFLKTVASDQDLQYLGIRRHAKQFCFRCGPTLETTSAFCEEGISDESNFLYSATLPERPCASTATPVPSGGALSGSDSVGQSSVYHDIFVQSSPEWNPSNKNNRYQETLAIKEALRLVCLISVRRKYSEQGLLRLKQEAPQVFQSICLYADVCYLVSNYNFRLPARRFLQELFQDVNFSDLVDQARRLL